MTCRKKPLLYLILLIGCLIGNALGQPAAGKLQTTSQTMAEYEKWVAPYKNRSDENRLLAGKPALKLLISVVSERDSSTGPAASPISIPDGKSAYGIKISDDGKIESFSSGPLGVKGGCCGQLEKQDLERVDNLLAKLPGDNSSLPPNGRRLILQSAAGGETADRFKVRVYDLANMPDEVLELLRLTRANIRSFVLWFKPEREWPGYDYSVDGGLVTTSDGEQIIASGLNGPIKIWQASSQSVLKEIPKPQNVPIDGLVLSPDNSFAVIDGWGAIGVFDARDWHFIRAIKEPFIDRKRFGLSKPHFIENGRYLLLESSEPALHIYDTKTWQRVNGSLPEVPADAVSYYPAAAASSKSGTAAVYSTKDDQIFLQNKNRDAAAAAAGAGVPLDKAKINYVAYSPDEKMVAIVTIHPGTGGNNRTRHRIRIWDTATGKFIRELEPFEREICESVEGGRLLWSPDGKYLLAANKADIFFTSRGISIWSLKSGRHRGELEGCPTKLSGFGFINKNKLAAGCGDGLIRIWDFEAALAKIKDFESQLN